MTALSTGKKTHNKIKILVWDSNTDDLRGMQSILYQNGFEKHAAFTEKDELLKVLPHCNVDVVLASERIKTDDKLEMLRFLEDYKKEIGIKAFVEMDETGYSINELGGTYIYSAKTLTAEGLREMFEDLERERPIDELRFFKRSFHNDALVVQHVPAFMKILDVSLSGLKVASKTDYQKGDQINIFLKAWSRPELEEMTATVVRKERIKDGFSYGLEFPHPILE